MIRRTFKAARTEFEKALADVIEEGRDGNIALGAVNYADIGVTDVQRVTSEDGRTFWRVIVEECAPGCAIPEHMLKRLAPDLQETEISCEW